MRCGGRINNMATKRIPRAIRLYRSTLSLVELGAMIQVKCAKCPERAVCRTCAKKFEDIARAVTWRLADKRAAEGDPVPTSGYSGRQSKRR